MKEPALFTEDPNLIVKFTCPDCGAPMAYDIAQGKLACAHCGCSSEIGPDPEEWLNAAPEPAPADTAGSGPEEAAPDQPPVCPNCGSPLEMGPKTCSSTCPYCGSSLAMAGRLAGDMRPAKILPFSMDRKKTEESFLKWCHNGRFAPAGFASKSNVKKIRPLYVPYWLYDMDARVDARAQATNVRVYIQGRTEFTETSFYDVSRSMQLSYHDVPYDASEKMADDIMQKIQPYNCGSMKDFQIPYLAGFDADQRDYEAPELLPLVKQQAAGYAGDYVRGTMNGYSAVRITHQDISWENVSSSYVYLPLWFISYKYQDKDYIFAMNGQTGKVVGDPPVAKGKVALWFAGISAIIFAVLMLIGGLL